MLVPLQPWTEDKTNENALLFAQRIQEMHWHYAPDSYRCGLLNTYFRTMEFISLVEQILELQLNQAMARPVIDELMWSLHNDIVLRKCFTHERDAFASILGDCSASIETKSKAATQFIRKIDSNYIIFATDILMGAVSSRKNEHKDILDVCDVLFPHILNIGYSPEFVDHECHEEFFAHDIANPQSSVLKFLDIFNEKPRRFTVYVSVSNSLSRVIESINTPFVKISGGSSINSTEKFKEFKKKCKFKNIYKKELEALDNHSARYFTESLLRTALSLARTAYPRHDLTWDDCFFVVGNSLGSGVILAKPLGPLEKRMIQPAIASSIVSDRERLVFGRSDNTRLQMFKSISQHANAFASEHEDSQLVSLWSALEVLMPPPPKGISRIQHFMPYIAACQTRTYLQRKMGILFIRLSQIFKKPFTDTILREGNYLKAKDKFIATLLLADNKDIIKEVGVVCANAPLARRRIYEFFQLSKSCRLLHDLIEQHSIRVQWQIHRIYRRRNSIVHSGDGVGRQRLLITNLHDYYYNVLDSLDDVSSRSTFGSLGDWFDDIKLGTHKYLSDLHSLGSEPVSLANISTIMNYQLHANK